KNKGKGVIGETKFIESLPFNLGTVKLGGIVATADPRDSNFKKILQLHQKASPRFKGIRKMAAVHEDTDIHAWADEPHLYLNKKLSYSFEVFPRVKLSSVV